MEPIAVGAGHDLSIYGLIMQADIVVKIVMALLALASVACWAIIVEKIVRLVGLSGDLRELGVIAKSESGEITRDVVARVIEAGRAEFEDGAAKGETRGEVRQRIERAMRLQFKGELQRTEVGLPFLATVGSAGPFIGLFGTVWGIMNSFTSIAQQKDTSLAVVAPGIAEALFATALGLVAAIPAVMAFNAIAVSLGRMSARGNASITEIARTMSKAAAEPQARAQPEPLRAAGKGF